MIILAILITLGGAAALFLIKVMRRRQVEEKPEVVHHSQMEYLPNVTIETVKPDEGAQVTEIEDSCDRDLEEKHNLEMNAI